MYTSQEGGSDPPEVEVSFPGMKGGGFWLFEVLFLYFFFFWICWGLVCGGCRLWFDAAA